MASVHDGWLSPRQLTCVPPLQITISLLNRTKFHAYAVRLSAVVILTRNIGVVSHRHAILRLSLTS